MTEGTVEQVLSGTATWCVIHGDYHEVLPTLPDLSIDISCSDPPYSEKVHKGVRSAKRNELPDVQDFACRTRRTVDLGFDHLTNEDREFLSDQFARLTKRWVLVFSDIESVYLWMRDLECDKTLTYAGTSIWVREGGAPRFQGDMAASSAEAIVMAYRSGRHDWNSGGKRGVYHHPIVANRLGQRGSRVHPTQKPEPLMVELIDDYGRPGELVLDATAGSSTTGVAALRRGLRYIGIERLAEHVATSRERLAVVEPETNLVGLRLKRNQQRLFR